MLIVCRGNGEDGCASVCGAGRISFRCSSITRRLSRQRHPHHRFSSPLLLFSLFRNRKTAVKEYWKKIWNILCVYVCVSWCQFPTLLRQHSNFVYLVLSGCRWNINNWPRRQWWPFDSVWTFSFQSVTHKPKRISLSLSLSLLLPIYPSVSFHQPIYMRFLWTVLWVKEGYKILLVYWVCLCVCLFLCGVRVRTYAKAKYGSMASLINKFRAETSEKMCVLNGSFWHCALIAIDFTAYAENRLSQHQTQHHRLLSTVIAPPASLKNPIPNFIILIERNDLVCYICWFHHFSWEVSGRQDATTITQIKSTKAIQWSYFVDNIVQSFDSTADVISSGQRQLASSLRDQGSALDPTPHPTQNLHLAYRPAWILLAQPTWILISEPRFAAPETTHPYCHA